VAADLDRRQGQHLPRDRNDTPYCSDTIQIIAGIVGVYRNFQNLLDYSERDSLTGLLNRKTFDDQLARMLSAHRARIRALPESTERRHGADEKQWLAVVDVDHFKGQRQVRPPVRRRSADPDRQPAAVSFRAQDRVFRFGGEEFVVLLRSTTLENARRSSTASAPTSKAIEFPQVGQVTVSVGFVSISAYESPVVTLGRADQALYYAKSHGRNQACHYDDLVSHGVLQTVASNDTAEFF
jgi:GGDEF domain-containing protein